MTLSLSKLQECAEKATPGPWYYTAECNVIRVEFPPNQPHVKIKIPQKIIDCEFIASFNPETAKALIRVARAAKEFMSDTPTGIKERSLIHNELKEALKEISE